MQSKRIALSRRATLAITLLALAACSRHPAPPRPKTAAPAAQAAAAAAAPRVLAAAQRPALMAAIFADDYRPASGDALSVIDTTDGKFAELMTWIAGAALPDGRVAVAVNGAPSNEHGDDDVAGDGQPGTLSVYLLRREGKGWTVLERHEEVASMGTHGWFGDIRWLALGPGKTGFVATSGGVWQGYAVGGATVYELDHDIRELGSFNQSSHSPSSCPPGQAPCWDIDGTIRMDDGGRPSGYADILVDFTGKRYTLAPGPRGHDVEHLAATIRQTVRYRFDGKSYVPVAGTNPVPTV